MMVKLKGPAVSAEARGKLADVLTFSTNPKTRVVKRHSRPSNPKTGNQIAVRAMMAFLAKEWKNISPADQATWEAPSAPLNVAPYHAYIKYNQARWNNSKTPTQAWPAAEAQPTPGSQYQDAYDGVASIRLRYYAGGGGTPWGWIIYRDTATMPTVRKDLAIALIARIPPIYTYYRDTPLEPGTYYYRAVAFTQDGVERWPTHEDSATAS